MIAAYVRRAAWRAAFRAAGGLDVAGPAPDGPCVIVANHSSHADTVALLAALPARRRPVVAAAADYWFATRARSLVCRAAVAGFPVRRARGGFDDLAAAAAQLARGRSVIVFPEGTRSRDGEVAEFRSGAARLADLAGVPLVPAGLTGTRDLLGVHGRLRRTRVQVRFGPATHDLGAARTSVRELAGQAPSG
ncbi:lysophospholipid acyltransferase family protein [Actinomadura yumaensis]|uniref:Lysophospholipid acyltransferase family protein n=1 Tax=Actinomadura yumaensis TaxID=111807 RepID=A0ABW2CZD1_9ACTN